MMNCEPAFESNSAEDFTERVPPGLIWGAALALFLATKTTELHLEKKLSWPGIALTQVLEYLLMAIFAMFLYRDASRKSTVNGQTDLNDVQQLQDEEAADDSSHQEHVATETASSEQPEILDASFIDVHEIESLVENVMAYSRYYQDTVDPRSQHRTDLMGIREQAIRVQEMMNRADPANSFQQLSCAGQEKKRVRRTPRTLDLVPVTVRGTAPNEESFRIASYTMNISPRGACLFLPDRSLQAGQKIHLQNHHFETDARVHWIVLAKAADTLFAGVEFSQPIDIS